jgi:hypothetical protein
MLLLSISCTSPKIDLYEQITPNIDIKEAISLATLFLDSTCCKGQYIKNSVRVWEWAADINYWHVQFEKNEDVRPSTFIVIINKENGKAELLLQR